MTRAVKLINYYDYKLMLLEGNPKYENFSKDQLISFCKIAQSLLKSEKIKKGLILNNISNYCNKCNNKERCSENKCILFRIEKEITNERSSKNT